nr:hypothetical protein [Tanacetum cinerariifolium]
MDPAGVAIAHQVLDLFGRQRQRTDQIPARQRKHAWLHRVEHHQQQMNVLDLVDVRSRHAVQLADAQRGGDNARRRARHAVGDELEVVRRVFASQALVHLFANVLAQNVAGESLALVEVLVVGVQRPEMHQLQGQFIVVLQRMNQRCRVDAELMHLAQHQPQKLGAAGQQRVLGVADDHLLRGEAWVEPVQRRLPFLEVMQVHPAAVFAVNACYYWRSAPVGFLDAGLEKDHPLQLADDVMLVAQRIHRSRRQVDGITARRDFREQGPVFFLDLHHVVETRVFFVGHFRQAKVRTFAGVGRNDVVDDYCVPALTAIEFCALLCGVEHRLLNQPFNVLLVRGGHVFGVPSSCGWVRMANGSGSTDWPVPRYLPISMSTQARKRCIGCYAMGGRLAKIQRLAPASGSVAEGVCVELHIVIKGRKDLARQVYQQLRDSIVSGRLAAGVQLPPSRLLAEQLGVSRKTISDTYSQLTYESYLIGKVGSGTFVNSSAAYSPRRAAASHLASADVVAKWERISLPLRHPTRAGTLRYDFLGGATAKTQFPHDDWRRCVQHALRQMSGERGFYGQPEGLPALRNAIAGHIAFARGVRCMADDVVVCNGAQQALDLIARVLTGPGY